MSFVGVIILLVMVLGLRTRVINLENELKKRNGAVLLTKDVPASTLVPVAPQQQTVVQPEIQKPQEPDTGDRFATWITENWLLKLGALLLLIGFGWLATYAFLEGWIGPMGRISLGLGLGTLILALGWWRMHQFPAQGSVFLVLGSTTILLTTFAARELYDFFTPLSALGIMFGTAAFIALTSVVFNRKTLGIAGVALAGIAPFLTVFATADYISLFAYLGVVIMGSLWVAFWQENRGMVFAALVAYAVYAVPLCLSALAGRYDPELPTLLLFAYGFAVLFYIANTAGLLRLKDDEAQIDIVTALGNALLLIFWVYVAVPEEWQSLIVSAWTVAFITGAFMLLKITGRYQPFYVYALVGAGYIAVATAMELSGPALTIAYTLESAFVSILTFVVRGDVRLAQKVSVTLIGPVILTIPSIVSQKWNTGVFHDDFFVLATLALVFLGLGLVYRYNARSLGDVDTRNANIALMVVGSLYTSVLAWLVLHAVFLNDDTAVMLALALYTVVGIGVYLEGVAKDYSVLRTYGGIILGGVVVRLLLVDVWNMQLTGRIVTFFLIGSLLMSTAFLSRKKQSPTVPTTPPHA